MYTHILNHAKRIQDNLRKRTDVYALFKLTKSVNYESYN